MIIIWHMGGGSPASMDDDPTTVQVTLSHPFDCAISRYGSIEKK